MYIIKISENLQEILQKLSKKDKLLYDRVLKKIHEIAQSDNVEHYKNLKYSLKDTQRVHIGPFVLVFQFNKLRNEILFDDFDHHDKIYIR